MLRPALGHECPTHSAFNERLQPGQCLIPLLGDEVEVFSRFLHGLQIECEAIFAAGAHTVDDSYILQDAKMLGDGLAGQPGAVSQFGNRMRLPAGESRHQ